MVTRIFYKDLEKLFPEDAISYILSKKKNLVKNVTVIDLLNEYCLKKPFAETYFTDIFPRGIYLFFDKNNNIRYVGKSNQGFLNRLMSHMDTTPHGYWGWNALLRKMGGERTNKLHQDLTKKDHEYDWKVAQNYKLILIEASHKELNPKELKWFEEVIMKAFRKQKNQRLLNTKIGWLTDDEWKTSIKNLVKE